MNKNQTELITTGVAIVFLVLLVAGNLKKKPAKKIVKETAVVSESLSPAAPPKVAAAATEEKKLALQKERANLAWGRDPFTVSRLDKDYQKADLELKGISFGKDKKGFAFINNEIVTVGDNVGDYQIAEIQKDKVLLRKENQSFYLTLPQE